MPRTKVAQTFKVIFEPEPDGSAWNVTIPSVQGCHTYGRSLAEARRNAREALAVSLDDDDRDAIAEAAVFEEDIRLPARVRAAVEKLQKTKANEELLLARMRELQRAVALLLTEQQRLSLRDAGEVLGMSPEGVRKVLKAG